jgi:hypothetical protein
MSALGICLALAAGLGSGPGPAPAQVFVPGQAFTLAWMHSIEKVRWEEDYVVQAGPQVGQAPILLAVKARVKGSAAGMEPPEDAVLENGWYEYTPAIPRATVLRLTRSEFTADYDLCPGIGGACQPMSAWLPSDQGITLLTPCVDPAG